MLQSYGLVKGDQFGDLKLYAPITRAEAATIFVRAAGQEQTALMIGSLSSFPDTEGHWAAGYITTAFRLGQMKGDPSGFFRPDAQITNAEVLTVLLRIVHKDLTGTWTPAGAVQAAIGLGIFNGGAPELVANVPGIRGVMFKSLAKALTTVPLETGKTALATYIDKGTPELNLEAVPDSTGADTIRLNGTAKGAAYVLVNGQRITLNSSSAFSVNQPLAFGPNSFKVEAYNWAGTSASKSVNVSRSGEAARIVVSGDVAVKTGESGTVNVKAYDARGVEIPTSLLKATVSNNLGTIDPATATFKAGTTAGKGTLTFTSGSATATANVEVLGLAAEAYSVSVSGGLVTQGKSTTITAKVLDQNGQLVTWDSGRTITLQTSPSDALWVTSSATAQTNRGVATFTVGALKEGNATVIATSSGLVTGSNSVQIASSTRIVLVPSTTSGGADGMTPVTIKALLQDEAGTPVTNTGSDIWIDLAASGATQASLTNRTLFIRSGSSSSTNGDGTLLPGFENETVNVTGTVRSGQSYTVIGTTVSFVKRQIGTPVRLELNGGGTYLPGTPITFSVTVRDSQGNIVPTNSFAFQLQATTNNNETPVGGMPPGLSVQLGTTGRNPVAAATGAVIGRTTNGYATLTVSYTKSGTVTLKLLSVDGSAGAWDTAGNFGGAYSSFGLSLNDKSVSWAGSPSNISVTADLPSLGLQAQPMAILPANGSAQARLKLQVLDTLGGKLPVVGTATLEKVGTGTASTPAVLSVNVTNGTAEFPVTATTNVGVDEYKLTFFPTPTTPLPPQNIKIATSNAPLASRPSILAINGQSGMINRVAAGDGYMEVQLPAYAGTWAVVKVYRASTNSLVYTSPVMDLSGSPYIRVPKANLTAGSDSYYITINNGYSDSPASDRYPASPNAVTVEALQAINIQQVRYNASTGTLTVTAAGIQPGGVLDLNKLALTYQAPASGTVAWGTPTCTIYSSYFTCTGVTIPASQNTLALLTTANGWYRYDPTGTVAQVDSVVTDNVVPGIGYISSAVLTFGTDSAGHVTARVTVNGSNLAGSVIYPELIKIGTESLGLPGQTLSASSSTSLTWDLPNFSNTGNEATSIAKKISLLNGSTVTITGASGWIRYGGDMGPAVTTGGGVYKSVNLSSIQYVAGSPALVITGSGFGGGTVRPASLKVVDRSGTNVFALSDPANTATTDPSGNQITINLTAAQANALDAPANNYRFNVFLVSDPVSNWFQSADGWYAIQLGNRLYPVGW